MGVSCSVGRFLELPVDILERVAGFGVFLFMNLSQMVVLQLSWVGNSQEDGGRLMERKGMCIVGWKELRRESEEIQSDASWD